MKAGPRNGHSPRRPPPALGQRALRRLEHALLAGQRDGRQIGSDGRVQALPPMRMRSASSREMAWRSPATSTVSGPSKGACAEHDDALVRQEAELGEVAQQPGIAVGHAPDHGFGAARELAQRPVVLVGQLELGRRDRVAVRIARRMAERRVDARLERLGEVVLEPLGLGMHLVPREPERLHQVELEQAVVADDLERRLRARVGQRDAVVRLVAHESHAREALDHRGRRGGGHAEALGERARSHAAGAIQHPDRLQVILDGLGHDEHEPDIRRL